MISPTALGYTSWRPGQEDAIRRAMALSPGRALFVEAPTGFGKSALPAALALERHTVTVLVAERRLQAQYEQAFPFAAVVWGKGNYICVNREFADIFAHRWGRPPTVDDCAAMAKLRCPDCPYRLAVERARRCNLRVLNYHYAFHSRWWPAGTDYVVLDEAHRIEGLLRELALLRFSERRRQRWSLPQFPKPELLPVARWLADAAEAIAAALESERRELLPADLVRERRGVKHLRWLASQLAASGADDWHIERVGDSLIIRPVVVAPFANVFTRQRAERPALILMSATIGAPDVMAASLDIQNHSSISLPHAIPAEQRPVYYVENAPAMSHRSDAADYYDQAQLILRILDQFPNSRGIIHTSSWSHAHMLATFIRQQRAVYTPAASMPPDEQVKQLVNSDGDTVCISPSFWEGVDLADDAARFAIVAKIPFPDYADPVNRLILRRPGGRAWYDWQAAVKTVQGCGRIVRHERDYGKAFIVDANWRRVRRLAPSWFEPQAITV